MNLNDIGRTEQIVAIAVGLGTYFLFDHFHLMPSGYMSGRLVARAAVLLGAGLVFIIWPGKKRS